MTLFTLTGLKDPQCQGYVYKDAYMHQAQALHLHQTRDLVSGTIKSRCEEDVTGGREERQKPLCALVDVVEANQYNRFFYKMYWDQLSAERRPKYDVECAQLAAGIWTHYNATNIVKLSGGCIY